MYEVSKFIWDQCRKLGMTEAGAAGVLGNFDAESALISNNLEDQYQGKLGMSDKTYTEKVDSREYQNFMHDCAGYGLAQWTWWTRKKGLLDLARRLHMSVGDPKLQMKFFSYEMEESFKSLLNTLRTTSSVAQATESFMRSYEGPAVLSSKDPKVVQEAIEQRVRFSEKYYKDFAGTQISCDCREGMDLDVEAEIVKSSNGSMPVYKKQSLLSFFKCYEGRIDDIWGPLTSEGTRKFQTKYGLTPDGIFGDATNAKARELIGTSTEDCIPNPPKPGPGDPCEDAERADQEDQESDDLFWGGEITDFKEVEFACQCHGRYCKGFPRPIKKEVVRIAQKTRDYFKSPVIVTSGLRCETHNAEVGGVWNSQHMYGEACDIVVRGHSASEVLKFLDRFPEITYKYAINNDAVHYNIKKCER